MAKRIDANPVKVQPKRLGVEQLTFVRISEVLRVLEPIGIRSKPAVRRLAEEGRIRVLYPFPSDRDKEQKMHPRYCMEDAREFLRRGLGERVEK